MEQEHKIEEQTRVIVTYDANGLATIYLKEFNDIKYVNLPSCTVKDIKLISDNSSTVLTRLINIENELNSLKKDVNNLPSRNEFINLKCLVNNISLHVRHILQNY